VSDVAERPLGYLARLLRHPDEQTMQMIADRDRVHREYGRLFHPDNLDRLGAEDLKGSFSTITTGTGGGYIVIRRSWWLIWR
jgi:hypothetical protein